MAQGPPAEESMGWLSRLQRATAHAHLALTIHGGITGCCCLWRCASTGDRYNQRYAQSVAIHWQLAIVLYF